MQGHLLDILILGLLVFLFGSIYRTRPSARLRYWIIGWAWVLADFGILLIRPASDRAAALLDSLGLVALLFCAVSFMLAAQRVRLGPRTGALNALLLCLPATVYIFLAVYEVGGAPVLIGVAVLAEALFVSVGRRLWFRHKPVREAMIPSAAVTLIWIAWSVIHGQGSNGTYAFLTQLYFINAVLYWQDFRRWSMGVITAVVGLAAWAAVFPCALALAAFLPNKPVSGELWNVPKFFVEFGMILSLLESEIITTSKQREEYRVLFDGNPHPMWITDLNTHAFLKVNRSAVLHYGYSEDEFLNMALRDITPPEDLPEFEDRMKGLGKVTFISGPWTHVKKDGTRIQVDMASHRIVF